jgi:hypothetical protein
LSPALSELGIHGNYEVVNYYDRDTPMTPGPRTLIFDDPKDQFLYELHGGQELFNKLHSEWGKQVLHFYSKSGFGYKK